MHSGPVLLLVPLFNCTTEETLAHRSRSLPTYLFSQHVIAIINGNRALKLFRSFFFLVLGMGVLSGCDSAPGVQDLSESPPQIHPQADFVSPRALDIESLTVTNGFVESSLTVRVTLADEDGDVSSLFVVVQSAVSGEDPIGDATSSVPGDGEIVIDVPLLIPEGAAGMYQVAVFASDTRGAMSNRIFGTFEVVAGNDPPVITAIDIPDVITRPPAGEPAISIPLIVHVDDPDGIQNIQKVEVQVNGGGTLFLCDDGGVGTCNAGFGTSGDTEAGDGAFTLTIQLEALNAPGEYLFQFIAEDRAGLRSERLTRTITVN